MSTDNPFEIDDSIDNEDDGTQDPNTSFAELRKAYNRMERAKKAADKELEELRTFQQGVVQEKRATQVKAAFEQVGLSEKHASLFTKVNTDVEDVTADVVAAFAAEYDLPTATGEKVPAPEPGDSGFKPVVAGTAPPLKQYTQEEIKALLDQGRFDLVNDAYAKGQVVKESAPWA